MSERRPDTPIRIIIAGAAGRMGRRLVALSREGALFQLAAALDREDGEHNGTDSGELSGIGKNNVPIQGRTEATFDVLIDFSTPAGTTHWLDFCLARRRAFVTGVTGLTEDHRQKFSDASQSIAVLAAPNMSPGVNLMLRLVRDAAAVLADYDAEIVETHHRFKRDAPSGTANALLDALRAGRESPDAAVVHGRAGAELDRPAGQIGIHSLRAGDVVGEHDVILSGLGETLTIRHRAHSRDVFVRGALRAAAWIVDQKPGLYSMNDVLFDA